MDDIPREISRLIRDKTKRGIFFLESEIIEKPPSIVNRFSDGSEIIISESGFHYFPPSEGKPQ